MKSKFKDAAVFFIIVATAFATTGTETSSGTERVPCRWEVGSINVEFPSSCTLAVYGPSLKDTAAGTSTVSCRLQLTAKKAGSFLLETRASSSGAWKNLSVSEMTLSQQRQSGTMIVRNQSSAGPFWLLAAEKGDMLNVTWRIANNSPLELHASFITNCSCGDDSMVNFRNDCYMLRSVADFGGSSSQMLAEFAAQFEDEEQLRAFVHHAVLKSPALKDNLTRPVLLGLRFCNSQLMYQNRSTDVDQQCQWTEFRGTNGSNLMRNVLLGATELEHQFVTLLVNSSSEPELGLISSKEAASGQRQVLLKFPVSTGLSRCDANNNSDTAAAGCHTGDQASSKLPVVLGCMAAAVIAVVTVVVILHRRRRNLSCPIRWNLSRSTCPPCTDNGSENGGTHDANNGATNGLLGRQQKEADSSV